MIFVASALVGIQTYSFHSYIIRVILHVFDQLILWIFVAEVVIKMSSEGKVPWVYFWDAWNIFDFVIVTASFLPLSGGQAVAVFRLLRLLRLLKLIKALPKMLGEPLRRKLSDSSQFGCMTRNGHRYGQQAIK